MRKAWIFGIVAAAACPAMAVAAGPLDGSWKVDVAQAQMPTKPFGWKIAGGSFSCVSCNVPYTVPSDGAFHTVAGQPYWDETAVAIVDPMTVRQTWKKGGKVTETLTSTVAADGASYAWTDIDSSAPNGQPQNSSGTDLRVSKGAPGSHALAGMWRHGKLASISDASISMTLATAGSSVTMTTPAGYHYTATVGGPAVPVVGDQAMTMASVAMPDASTLIETDSRGGKTVSVLTLVAQPDGKTMKATFDDTLRGTTARYVAMRQ